MKPSPFLLLSLLAGALALPAPASAQDQESPSVKAQRFASGYTSPLVMLPYQSGPQAFLVADQIGTITFLSDDGGQPGAMFLDLRDRMVELKPKYDERGLLGLALHPDFASNHKFYVYYSAPLGEDAPEGYNHTSHLSEFTTSPDGKQVQADSERILMRVHQPQGNHNGGHTLFGPDGYLYIALGDGGRANDTGLGHPPEGNGQALDQLLGKILRIDVNSGDPYSIPRDNPYHSGGGQPEIFAYGLRNPWGLSFTGDGQLMAGEVGQNRFEEINVIRNGENYGWPRVEGYAPFDKDNPAAVPQELEDAPGGPDMTQPVLVYPHSAGYGESKAYGISVTGGAVYQGKAIPGLQGHYVFADWAMSWAGTKHGLFAAKPGSGISWDWQLLKDTVPPTEDAWVIGFAQDKERELYVLTNGSTSPANNQGAIWKLIPGN